MPSRYTSSPSFYKPFYRERTSTIFLESSNPCFETRLRRLESPAFLLDQLRAMLGLSWPALAAVAAIHSAAATPLPAPMSLIVPSSNMSTSTAPGVIDRRFRIVIASQGTDVLPTDPGLMATAEMLYRLGKCDVNGVIEPRTYVDHKFPAVSVSIRGRPGAAGTPTRFALWGIYKASERATKYSGPKHFELHIHSRV